MMLTVNCFDNYFFNYSNFKTTLLDGTDDHLPYNQANNYISIFYKEGNDFIILLQGQSIYIADLGLVMTQFQLWTNYKKNF